ncbi:ArgE/DapE family deacylase [Bordetella genomosp. 13]|uniref:Probable succinyl-diaminopimelate desuccinylase n=1 Tax=Bordetella genomosp. 13 TaxID=463040 RepID=A0A1W6ZEK6_9BORD|nr:ArgE/DapE family deacylase [Bordetella genomosp. 13]ARP95304.1 acetylornithine deacetylase [Bordetella genomosp. 13]
MSEVQVRTLSASEIEAAVEGLEHYMTDTLSRFVQCRSLPGQETPAAEFMEAELARLGLQSERIALRTDAIKDLPLYSPACCPDGGRYNVLACHQPQRPTGRSVLFNGHLDVVPTGPEAFWTESPFKGGLHDGWLYGRGAGDMKAGIVCALAAFKALQSLGVQPAAMVGFNGVLEEENTGNGTLATVSALQSAIGAAKLTSFDAVLIPEPTQEGLMSAQVGVFWMYVDIVGKPAHASLMTTGINPVDIGLRVMEAVKKIEHEWNLPENRHPAYREHAHPINFNLGQIHAGDWNSSVPSVCTLGLRLSCYPDMPIETAKARIEACIRQVEQDVAQPDTRFNIRYEGFHAPGCEYDLDVPALQLLADAHQRVAGEPPRPVALTGTTDGRHFHFMMEAPVTCYGPIARNYHGFNESVSVQSMLRVAKTYALFLHDWCGVEPRLA